jgi:tetratricopeptide (TPR) repeat protein
MRALVVSALLCAVAHAAPPKGSIDEARVQAARSHYELGRVLFKENKFVEALKEFEAGYALVPQPRFLLNMGQAYRSLKQPHHAVEMYEKFLTLVPPGDPDRAQVDELLTVVRAEADKMPRPAAPPLQPPPAPAPAPSASAPATTIVAAPRPKQSFARRHWWLFPVVGVAVAGLAVGLGVGLTQSGGACRGSEPCLDLGAR